MWLLWHAHNLCWVAFSFVLCVLVLLHVQSVAHGTFLILRTKSDIKASSLLEVMILNTSPNPSVHPAGLTCWPAGHLHMTYLWRPTSVFLSWLAHLVVKPKGQSLSTRGQPLTLSTNSVKFCCSRKLVVFLAEQTFIPVSATQSLYVRFYSSCLNLIVLKSLHYSMLHSNWYLEGL